MTIRIAIAAIAAALIASCTGSGENCQDNYFCQASQELEKNGLLTETSAALLSKMADLQPALRSWEQEELSQHIDASQHRRFIKEEVVSNIERVLSYKWSQKMRHIYRRDSLQRIHLKSIYGKLSDQNLWDSAFVEDCYWGKSEYMVVLIPQVHEVNNTPEEHLIVNPVQRNILKIMRRLRRYGASAFLYEGIPFKEISRELPTKTPLDSIAKYFSKKIEIQFETDFPDVLSYGMEDKELHSKADSLRSYYWTMETFSKQHNAEFPMDYAEFRQMFAQHTQNCVEKKDDVNLIWLNAEIMDSLVDNLITSEAVTELQMFENAKQKVFNEMLELMLNMRNRSFVNNMERLQEASGDRFIVMKAGTSHFAEVDLIKEYDNFSLVTVQEILMEKGISYIYLVPYYVWHYNL
jgi:hypothetical protein